MPQLEKNLEAAFVRWCKSIGVQTRKLNGLGNRDWPDRMVCLPVAPLYLEFKAPGKKLTELQSKKLNELYELGYATNWADSLEKAKQATTEVLADTLQNLSAFDGVETTRLSKACSEILARAERGGVVPKTGARKNQHNLKVISGSKGRKAPKESPDNSAA